MKSNLALVSYLKSLSPVFEKLVEKALKKNIFIISSRKALQMNGIGLGLLKDGRKAAFGAFPIFRCGVLHKTIIVAWPEVKSAIRNGELELELVEIAFAHEISHNISWRKRPFCERSQVYRHRPECGYFELLADYISLKIIEKARCELFSSAKAFFKGKQGRYLEIFHHFSHPQCLIDASKKCCAIEARQLKKCPREKETERLAEEIERFKI